MSHDHDGGVDRLRWPRSARVVVAGLCAAVVLSGILAVAGWAHQPDKLSHECLDQVTEDLVLYVGWLDLDINELDIYDPWDRLRVKTDMMNGIRSTMSVLC